ncbi:hypothetical protein NCG89_03380 [Spongiibacter taiwanensis]|uniref:MaoC family dehydratase n=1 Tax=Spongiibacter taiwanensis TaxID=1748242 RepID=UPI0020354278|nr:MaoC/PaaZ C-terminal domain-containing protein [Spongiibacter taiwanensis]USA43834.1 hypothetical protein NCG89_03380 [Spongiibacter taiwanensis]
MTASNQIQMKSLPSTPPLLLRAAFTRKSPGRQISTPPAFPDTRISAEKLRIDKGQLQRYRQVCGFDTQSNLLPMSFLHVLAFRLQMSMMLEKDFPVTPMGCIHLTNTLRQFRPIELGERPTLDCRIGETRLNDKGIEFQFICRAYVDQDKVWEDESLYLSRAKTSVPADSSPRPALRPFDDAEIWKLHPRQARQYARASGDFNPIHLHNLSAKILGFKKMVIHGMWSQAACIAALSDQVGERSECFAQFKTPIFLPAKVQFCQQEGDKGIDFALRNERGDRPHLDGYLRDLD